MEYAIHGKYKRNSDDHNGVFGCWFIPLKELVKTFTKRSLNDALREFEEEAIEARKEAIDILYSQEEEEDTAAPTAVTDVTTMSSLVQATRSHALAQLCHAAAQVGVVRCAVRHLPRVTTGACDTLRTYSAVTVPCAPCSNSLSQIVFLRCPLRCLLTCASAWARLIEVFGRVCHNPG